MGFQRVIALSALREGELRPVAVDGIELFVVRIGERAYAYEDACPHAGVQLSEGTLRGCVLTCERHGWQFDVATGDALPPARTALTSYAVEVRGGHVLVDVKRSR